MSESFPKDVHQARRYLRASLAGVALGIGFLYEASTLLTPAENQAMDEYHQCVIQSVENMASQGDCIKSGEYPGVEKRLFQTLEVVAGLSSIAVGLAGASLTGKRVWDHNHSVDNRFEAVMELYNAELPAAEMRPWPAAEDL